MKFSSYAQNFEDVVLWRALAGVEQGFYIDVGANDPEIDSVTKAFYDRGWRGINVEPIEHWHVRLERERPRDINLRLAAGAENGEIVLYELPQTGLSTSLKATAERHETEYGLTKVEHNVRVETLTSICQRLHLAPIHFLKIDVEGAEESVLRGIDFERLRPWIVVVESTLPASRTENHLLWEPLLEAGRYRFAYFDGLNRFYIAAERCDMLLPHFAAPPNVFDDFTLSSLASQAFCTAPRVRAETAEARLIEQRERADRLTEQLTKAISRAEVAEQRVLDQDRRANIAEQRILEQQQRAEADEQFIAKIERKLRQIEQRAVEAEQQQRLHADRAEDARQIAHRWWLEATAIEAERTALRSSLSWRVTRPLRWGASLVIGRRPLSGDGGQPTGYPAKRVVQRPLIAAMRSVLSQPALSYHINQRLMERLPFVHERLRRVARSAGLVPEALELAGEATPTTDGEELKLTPRARQIYNDLKAAIDKRQEVTA